LTLAPQDLVWIDTGIAEKDRVRMELDRLLNQSEMRILASFEALDREGSMVLVRSTSPCSKKKPDYLALGKLKAKIVQRSNDTRKVISCIYHVANQSFTEGFNRSRKVFALCDTNVTKIDASRSAST
jgi:hypothetical protein